MASINDKFAKVLTGTTRPVATTLASQKLVGATTATVQSTTGWETSTAVHGIMYRVDASNVKIPGSQIDWKGVVSGTTIGSFTVTAGTDDTYEVGTVVELSPTAAWGDDMATGLEVAHNQDGTIKDGAISTASKLASDVVTTAKILDANVTTAKIADSAITSAKVATGVPVQVVNTVSTAVATGTTQIPFDDTIPQITEGDEYMTLAITPKSATNILVIEAIVWLSSSAAARNLSAALFQDSTANALAAGSEFTDTTATLIPRMVKVRHTMVAGTTSSTTFRIRAGASNTGTTTFNGVNAARIFGAINKSSIVITEYKA